MWERGLHSCRYKTYIPACIIEAVCVLCVGEGVFGTCRNKTLFRHAYGKLCVPLCVYVGGEGLESMSDSKYSDTHAGRCVCVFVVRRGLESMSE